MHENQKNANGQFVQGFSHRKRYVKLVISITESDGLVGPLASEEDESGAEDTEDSEELDSEELEEDSLEPGWVRGLLGSGSGDVSGIAEEDEQGAYECRERDEGCDVDAVVPDGRVLSLGLGHGG